MQKIRFVLIGLFVFISVSCAELQQIVDETLSSDQPLTRSEIIAGLKEALVVGTNKSVQELGVVDGYYGDELVKIYLPPEANEIIDNINKIPGGEELIEDVLLRINRAAEDAVSEAKPIFVNAITSMTIPDAVEILRGEDDAATRYLYNTTYDSLYELYRPRIERSVNKKLVGNMSTAESWDLLTDKWNDVAGTIVGQVAGMKTVDVDLDEYLTSQALEGLFLKIEREEQRIRENPAARVTDLLRRVFGSVDA